MVFLYLHQITTAHLSLALIIAAIISPSVTPMMIEITGIAKSNQIVSLISDSFRNHCPKIAKFTPKLFYYVHFIKYGHLLSS